MNQTDRVRSYFEKLAPKYDERMRFIEKHFVGDGRRWACSQARGDVLETAIGTGLNLAFYPEEVRLTGIDLSGAMLDIARRRATELGRQVDLLLGDVEALGFANGSFDTVVCTLSLCCVPDVGKAVVEMKRVLRPGGRLVLLDHVISDRLLVRAIQRIVEPLWKRLHADSLLRRPLKQVRAERFEILWQQRLSWGIIERLIARKPA